MMTNDDNGIDYDDDDDDDNGNDDDDDNDCACVVVRKSTIATPSHILLVTGQ